MRIGTIAKRVGVSVATIRYYEQIGLLVPAARSGGQRLYRAADVALIAFIRRCRDLGFSLTETAVLLGLRKRADPCADARALAQERLAALRAKIAVLQDLERSVSTLVSNCPSKCCRHEDIDCAILR
jgi:MerR family transcriptional regulator, copper efflux regulator